LVRDRDDMAAIKVSCMHRPAKTFIPKNGGRKFFGSARKENMEAKWILPDCYNKDPERYFYTRREVPRYRAHIFSTASWPRTEAFQRRSPARESTHFEKARMILADMWRKKMDPINESERTRTMNGSLKL
jgi:hypothetical protein